MLIKICGFIAIALYTLLGMIQCVKIAGLEKRVTELERKNGSLSTKYHHLREKLLDVQNDMDGYASDLTEKINELRMESTNDGAKEYYERWAKFEDWEMPPLVYKKPGESKKVEAHYAEEN